MRGGREWQRKNIHVYKKHYVLREEIKCCQGVNSCTIYCTRCITSKLLGKDFFVYVLIRVYVIENLS